MNTAEQEVFEALDMASNQAGPWETIEEAREFFGPEAWRMIVKIIDDHVEGGKLMSLKWGTDDDTVVKMGEGVPIINCSNIDGWKIQFYTNNVLEVWPLGPGASGAGAMVINL